MWAGQVSLLAFCGLACWLWTNTAHVRLKTSLISLIWLNIMPKIALDSFNLCKVV